MSRIKPLALAFMLCLSAPLAARAAGSANTVIYDGKTTQVTRPPGMLAPANDLWVTMHDLEAATGFVIKPQGVCRNELCFPLPKKEKADFIAKRGAVSWFNLSGFARLIKQPVAYDESNSVWAFGRRPDAQNEYVQSGQAPDFTLPDMAGKKHSLSSFRGKKVLLLTWASW